MYKLVVLCAFFAIAASDPGVLLAAPAYATYVAPATTTISKQASSVIHPSPLLYNSPAFTHFLKKRSPQLHYVAPIATQLNPDFALTTTYTTPYVQAAPIQPAVALQQPIAAAHLIKKRSTLINSPAFIPTIYSPASPVLETSYTAPLISQPYGLPTHYINKRSAPILNAYVAPASYSHQSRIDLKSAPLISSYAPLAYSAPIPAFSHIY